MEYKHIILPLINPLNAELNPIYHLLALLGAHHILHVNRIRVKLVSKILCHVFIVMSQLHMFVFHVVFFVINTYNQGKILCSPCISTPYIRPNTLT